MIISAYDTTIGSAIRLEPLVSAIKNTLVQEDFVPNLNVSEIDDTKPIFITGYLPTETDIPLFAHPLLVQHKTTKYLVADIRHCVKSVNKADVDTSDLSYETVGMRTGGDYVFMMERVILQALWYSKPSSWRNDLSFAGLLYAHWMSDIISKRFALDAKDALLVCIVAHLHYQMLFTEIDDADEAIKNKWVIHSANTLKYNATLVSDVLDKMEHSTDLAGLCDNIRNVTANIRLSDLNAGTLITAGAGSWYGYEGKLMCAVAMEHVPTWLAIVHSSLNERLHKNSLVARVASRFQRNNSADAFNKAFVKIIQPYVLD